MWKPENRARLVLVVLILLLLGGTAWAVRGMHKPKPAKLSAEAMALRAQWQNIDRSKMKPEDWQQLREKGRQLSEDQKQLLRQMAEREQAERYKQFFAKPKEEQLAELDELLKRSAERDKEREARAKVNGGQSGPPRSGPRDGAQMPTPDQMDERGRSMLNQTTLEERSMRTTFRLMMKQRALELGLPMTRGGGGRGGPPQH